MSFDIDSDTILELIAAILQDGRMHSSENYKEFSNLSDMMFQSKNSELGK